MKKALIIIIVLLLSITITVLGINFYIKKSTANQIITIEESKKIKDIDCIIILGAGVWGDSPSPLLEDRLTKGIELYKEGIAPKIIMSGDHGKKDYDEVNIMKKYAIDENVPSEDIFMDHAGFSTYESIYRAREIFKVKKVLIVSQEYHLYRALYIANKLGIKAYGIPAQKKKYGGDTYREQREILARNKDFIKTIFKPKPTFLGEEIPVSKDGNITNDK